MRTVNRPPRLILFALLLAPFISSGARAQFFEVCETGSVDELVENIRAHSEHIFRLNYKFDHVNYLQTSRLPSELELPRLNDVVGFLEDLMEPGHGVNSRNAAALFYAYSEGRLCTWLMPSSEGNLLSYVSPVEEAEFGP